LGVRGGVVLSQLVGIEFNGATTAGVEPLGVYEIEFNLID
jgi:hypothetical protein